MMFAKYHSYSGRTFILDQKWNGKRVNVVRERYFITTCESEYGATYDNPGRNRSFWVSPFIWGSSFDCPQPTVGVPCGAILFTGIFQSLRCMIMLTISHSLLHWQSVPSQTIEIINCGWHRNTPIMFGIGYHGWWFRILVLEDSVLRNLDLIRTTWRDAGFLEVYIQLIYTA